MSCRASTQSRVAQLDCFQIVFRREGIHASHSRYQKNRGFAMKKEKDSLTRTKQSSLEYIYVNIYIYIYMYIYIDIYVCVYIY